MTDLSLNQRTLDTTGFPITRKTFFPDTSDKLALSEKSVGVLEGRFFLSDNLLLVNQTGRIWYRLESQLF